MVSILLMVFWLSAALLPIFSFIRKKHRRGHLMKDKNSRSCANFQNLWRGRKCGSGIESQRSDDLEGGICVYHWFQWQRKSTLLKILGGLLPPTTGNVLLDGQDIYAMNAEQLAQVRRQKIGFIFQDFRLFPEYTVRDNILIPFYLDHRTPDEQMLRKLTGILGIAEKLDARPSQISGGQQQRVAIARALIGKPRIVFADEPTGNLDTRTGEDTMKLLTECAAEFGQTLIVVTHNPEIAKKASRSSNRGWVHHKRTLKSRPRVKTRGLDF